MKTGDKMIGFKSETLHARLVRLVSFINDEDWTISRIAREAVAEKLERMETQLGYKRTQSKVAALVETRRRRVMRKGVTRADQ